VRYDLRLLTVHLALGAPDSLETFLHLCSVVHTLRHEHAAVPAQYRAVGTLSVEDHCSRYDSGAASQRLDSLIAVPLHDGQSLV
jgi:hypothetical protein